MIAFTDPLHLSTWPFVEGVYGLVSIFLIPNFSHKLFMIPLMKLLPLSLKMCVGVPCILMTCSSIACMTVCVVICLHGIIMAYLVAISIMFSKYFAFVFL